jgi:DNA-directed RNA polymerase subunit RPC12/RpoP
MSEERGMIDAVCPSCGQAIRVHHESIAIGAEILCPECDALLGVERRDPLSLVEVDPDDF